MYGWMNAMIGITAHRWLGEAYRGAPSFALGSASHTARLRHDETVIPAITRVVREEANVQLYL